MNGIILHPHPGLPREAIKFRNIVPAGLGRLRGSFLSTFKEGERGKSVWKKEKTKLLCYCLDAIRLSSSLSLSLLCIPPNSPTETSKKEERRESNAALFLPSSFAPTRYKEKSGEVVLSISAIEKPPANKLTTGDLHMSQQLPKRGRGEKKSSPSL